MTSILLRIHLKNHATEKLVSYVFLVCVCPGDKKSSFFNPDIFIPFEVCPDGEFPVKRYYGIAK